MEQSQRENEVANYLTNHVITSRAFFFLEVGGDGGTRVAVGVGVGGSLLLCYFIVIVNISVVVVVVMLLLLLLLQLCSFDHDLFIDSMTL